MKKLTIHRMPYTRADGTPVKGATFKTPNRGATGKTPKSGKWYSHKVHTGWEKRMPAAERRKLMLKAHKRQYLSAARAVQALANVTADPVTKLKARQDALYFYRMNRKGKKV